MRDRMKMIRAMSVRLAGMFRRGPRDSELAAEMEAHLRMHIEDNVRRGMSPSEARRQALIKLGGMEQAKESYREQHSVPFIGTLMQDVRYGLRMLRKSPGFTIVAVLTLALGIGANTAIFSIVDFLVLRPLPVERPGQVVYLTVAQKGHGPHTAFSYPDFIDIQKQTANVFSDRSAVGMFVTDGLSVNGQSQPIWSSYVTGDFFRLLGLKPALGRLILPSEGSVAGADPVVVLSYAYWQSRFNGDPSVIGTKASVNGVPVTIVGVAPQSFHGLTSLVDFQGYIPLGMAATLKDIPTDFLEVRADS